MFELVSRGASATTTPHFMAFKNKSQRNPTLPAVTPPQRPMGAAPPPVAPRNVTPAASGGPIPPGGPSRLAVHPLLQQARNFGNVAVQQPWRPRRQQLITPGMPQAAPYPQAVRTF